MRQLAEVFIFLAGIVTGFKLSQWRRSALREAKTFGFVSKPLRSHRLSPKAFWQQNQTPIAVITLGCCALIFGQYFGQYGYIFKASLLDLPKTEFTGTTLPITHVPDWTQLSAAERTMHFDQIPRHKIIPIPEYNLAHMKAGEVWESSTDAQRNAYITYPVPNLGNYQLDATENTGSHPGVDIKTLIGTPVHSIANGVVYKVGRKSSGFGISVSVAHIDVPDPRNPHKNITLVSTYAHLSETHLREGQSVTKGEVIGKTGDTGFATAPHLHFQIDRSDAPFIPYWPFTYNQLKQAGYNSNFDAVKDGFGKQNARTYTQHPFNFIAKHNNQDIKLENLVAVDDSAILGVIEREPVADSQSSVAPQQENNRIEKWDENQALHASASQTSNLDPQPATLPNTTPAHITKPAKTRTGQLEISFETDQNYTPGTDEIVKIKINEANLVASAGIALSSTLRDRAKVEPQTLTADDFDANGMAQVVVKTDSQYPFRLVAEGTFGEVKSPSLKPEIFSDVPGSHAYASAVKFLKDNQIVKGYDDGTFRPDQTLNRAEALKLILEANSIFAKNTNQQPFNDVDAAAWFAPYVQTAFVRNIVKGYEDGSFKPGNTVSRAEFLKMAIATGEFQLPEFTSDPYPDTPRQAWFTPYFALAKSHQLLRVKAGNTMTPHHSITRGEAAEVIYKLSQIVKRY